MRRWWNQAECLDGPLVDFESLTPEVEALCAACPVRTECLDAALAEEGAAEWDVRFMVRGGLTPLARHRLAVERGLVDEPAQLVTGKRCIECDARLVPSRTWLIAAKAQREEWWENGLAKAGGYERCEKHATAYKRAVYGRPTRARERVA